MKILYVITKSNWGGAQRHVFDLATSMKAKGHDVWVAVGGNGILTEKLERAGIYTFSIATLGRDISPGKDAGSFREIYTIIKNKRPDILHLHSPKASGLGALAGRLLHIKTIITTVHGWTFNESRPIYERIPIIFFSWITMILSHTTILLSEAEYSQALYFPFVKHKITLIPLGIKPPTLMSVDGSKQMISKSIGMELTDFNKKVVIGTIAELHKNKGLTYLVNSMTAVVEQQPNAICIIIGDGQENINIQTLIKGINLEKNVFLVGYIDNAADYLKAFNIFALSSIKEGLPYVILEAGCASLPVVATTVGGIPEIVEDMKSGILIQSRNSRELSHALSFMIEHPEERKKYGANLKERVLTKFSMEKMIWMIEGLYGNKGIDINSK
ncbi:MAG: glycosyltransferase family 4 protein [Candidatus Taylorbacteria bacterium]